MPSNFVSSLFVALDVFAGPGVKGQALTSTTLVGPPSSAGMELTTQKYSTNLVFSCSRAFNFVILRLVSAFPALVECDVTLLLLLVRFLPPLVGLLE